MKKIVCVIVLIAAFVVCVGAYQGGIVHTVQQGETLSKIVRQYMPLTAAYTKKELVNSIKSINAIDGALSPGQAIRIPVVWEQPLKPRIIPRPKTFEAKGLYMNPSSAGTRFVLDAAYQLRLQGGNTIVFDAKDDCGGLSYESPIPKKYAPGVQYTPNIEEFPKMIEYLHRMGVHVVARVVVLKDPIMAKIKPQWCYKREKDWLDPANPEVQEYILTIIRELCASGVDEIQLDYIRYFADRKTLTSNGTPRTDIIAGFIKKMHDVTSSRQVLLSMDMFGIVVWQRDVDVLTVGQDVMKLKNSVDIISPMLYPSHFSPGFGGIKYPANEPYKFVMEGITRMKELVGDAVVIRPWLQAFPLHVTQGWGPGYIKKQIEATDDAGGIGWLLWSPGNKYRDSFAAMGQLKQEKRKPRPAVKRAAPAAGVNQKAGKAADGNAPSPAHTAIPATTDGVKAPQQPSAN